MSRKYTKNLSEYLTKGEDLDGVSYISKEFLELMKQKCETCMKDRIECALQPHCENRKYINVLIDMKVKPLDLPAFCYTQHQKNIDNFLKGKAYIVDISDTKIYLADFLELLGEKKILKKSIDKICDAIELKMSQKCEKFYSIMESERSYLFITDGSINKFDFASRVITFNMQNEFPKDEIELQNILTLLKSNFNILLNIQVEMMGWWYLEFIFDEKALIKKRIKKIEQIYKELMKNSTHVYYFVKDDALHLLIDLKTPNHLNWKKIKYPISKLLEIFRLVTQIDQD